MKVFLKIFPFAAVTFQNIDAQRKVFNFLSENLFHWLIVFSVRSNFPLQILSGILEWY